MVFSPHSQTGVAKLLSRETFIQLLQTGIKEKSLRFTRQAAESWLELYPGDLGVQLQLARSMFVEGLVLEAKAIVERLCILDSEFLEAQKTRAHIYRVDNSEQYAHVLGCVVGLGGPKSGSVPLPMWVEGYQRAYEAIQMDKLNDAEELANLLIGMNVKDPLVDILHLRVADRLQDVIAVKQLAQLYHERYPDCLQISLILADKYMQTGNDTDAVSLLHTCVSMDASGQVPRRLWGEGHPYLPLWLEQMEIDLEMSIPANVASHFGWNRLSSGVNDALTESASQRSEGGDNFNFPVSEDSENVDDPSGLNADAVVEMPDEAFVMGSQFDDWDVELQTDMNMDAADTTETVETVVNDGKASMKSSGKSGKQSRKVNESKKTLRPVEQVFEQLAKSLNRSHLTKRDGRFPVYVIFTSRKALENKYGPQTAEIIIQHMNELKVAISRRLGWNGLVFMPDDAGSVVKHGMEVLEKFDDPWEIKHSLSDLEKSLAKKGEMIGALLIVGGPDVVPFHQLPNPTDDLDESVPSDNPYATLDSNYFVPEWAVGRLPDEKGTDPGLLIEQLRYIIQYHSGSGKYKKSWWKRSILPLDLFIDLVGRLFGHRSQESNLDSNFGYTAAIWQRSSIAVFRPLGQAQSLMVCPPEYSGSFNKHKITSVKLGYFNLHGVAEGSDWYGQRDFADESAGPDYPIALTPSDITKNGSAPHAVFSEACYGGRLDNKKIDSAISLKFLSIGTKAVIVSTCTAYGSIMSPLIGADLLGYLFWKLLKDGNTLGESLMQAKIQFANEMNKRQGYLDAEDQKTLLSFVLYGDPLLGEKSSVSRVKSVERAMETSQLKNMQDCPNDEECMRKVPGETIHEVKKALESYLPGIDVRSFHYSKQVLSNETSRVGKHGSGDTEPKTRQAFAETGNIVMSVSKEVKMASQTHAHYARATVNAQGKVVKLAVSR